RARAGDFLVWIVHGRLGHGASTTRAGRDDASLGGDLLRGLVLDHLVALGVRRWHSGVLDRLPDLRILAHLVAAFRVVPEVDDHHAVVRTNDRRRDAAILSRFAARDFL